MMALSLSRPLGDIMVSEIPKANLFTLRLFFGSARSSLRKAASSELKAQEPP